MPYYCLAVCTSPAQSIAHVQSTAVYLISLRCTLSSLPKCPRQGFVWYPAGFWHKPFDHWISYENKNSISNEYEENGDLQISKAESTRWCSVSYYSSCAANASYRPFKASDTAYRFMSLALARDNKSPAPCFANKADLKSRLLTDIVTYSDLQQFVRAARPPELQRGELFPLRADGSGKVYLPPSRAMNARRQVKVSVGESFGAPNSKLWFEQLTLPGELVVYAFEPNALSCATVTLGVKLHGENFRQVETPYINRDYFLTCAAASDEAAHEQTFYGTSVDPGTSSLNEPNAKNTIAGGKVTSFQVPVVPLRDFFQRVKWTKKLPADMGPTPFAGVQGDEVAYISQFKTDAQGHDMKVWLGAAAYLTERVVYVTPELDAPGYKYKEGQAPTSEHGIASLKSLGFELVQDTSMRNNCVDPVFVNTRLKFLAKVAHVSCEGL